MGELKDWRSRPRAKQADMEAFRDAVLDLVTSLDWPLTVRQAFYQATVRGLVEKTEQGYARVQRAIAELRLGGRLSWDAIADHTRWMRKPTTYNNPEDAIADLSASYRKALWTDAGCSVEIWLEKDALAGVLYPITARYDVPLMVTRGYASLSFLMASAQQMAESGETTYVYHLGDYDPSGVNAGENVERRLMEFAPDAHIIFKRIAVTPRQIRDWRLPSRPTKTTDARAAKFGAAESVELDAIEPGRLRRLVEDHITQHIPAHALETHRIAEQSEKDGLAALAKAFGRKRRR